MAAPLRRSAPCSAASSPRRSATRCPPASTARPGPDPLGARNLVAEAAEAHGLGADAAALYLMLLALPDPTDRNCARWTGWKPARLKAARAELAATDLVVEAKRARAGRTLFLPGGWLELQGPHLPLETLEAAAAVRRRRSH